MDVAEELLDFEHVIDRPYVERRLVEWRGRIDHLYADIETWLPADWSLVDGGEVSIHEDLMLRHGVPRQALPLRILRRSGRDVGRIEPRGLWIIGANGRVDLVLPDRHFLIVDRAESFAPPRWTITPLRDRLDVRPLTEATFKASLV